MSYTKQILEIADLERQLLLLVAKLLSKEGYTPLLGPIPDDVGADLLLTNQSGQHLVVETKLYRRQTTSAALLDRAIEQLRRACGRFKAAEGLLVITSPLTSSQRDRIKLASDLRVWDIADLTENVAGQSDLASMLSEIVRNLQFSPVDHNQAIYSMIANVSDEKADQKTGATLAAKLESGSAGRAKGSSKAFEEACQAALEFLFKDEFIRWKPQPRVDDGFHRFDLTARLVPNAQFWLTIASDFRCRYVVFEFKNYEGPITQAEVYTTEKYLFLPALRSVAIIVARNGVSASAEKAIAGSLREQGKLILTLTMQELCQLLREADLGNDPTNLLFQKLDDLLINLTL